MFEMRDVHWLLDLADDLGLTVWVDGGWAVDALVGRQTRPHADLDIEITTEQAPELVAALRGEGFQEIGLEYRRDFNFVFAHSDGRQIDFHLIDLDGAGNGHYGDHGAIFSAAALAGTGVIAGRGVRCIEPATLLRFHTGYVHDADDEHDVRLLCATFGLPIPAQYG